MNTCDPCLLVHQHPWWKRSTSENKEEDPDAPEPAAEGEIQMQYSSD